MAHHPLPASDDADRGTQLGSATRVLARVFTAVLLPFSVSARVLRQLGRPLATVARTLGAWVVAGLLAHAALWYAAPATLVWIVAVPVSMTICPVLLVVVGSALYLPFVAARQIWRWIALPIRFVERLLVAVITFLLRMLRRWAAALGRVFLHRNRRIAHSVGVAYLRARARATDVQPLASSAVHVPHPSTVATHDLPFEVVAYQNEYLPSGATEVHAIIELVACGAHSTDRGMPEAAEVILLDCSGSMGQPWSKLRAARHATGVAIDALRDGTWFAIVRGSQHAEAVYPAGGGLARATSTTRAAAKAALRLVWPEGGTAMGQWLLLARDLFASRPSAIPHAILLTDGKNESERSAAFEAALGACSGQFQCDCRGIGTEWNVGELRAISSRLLGTVDIVRDPTELADDFRAMAEAAMAKEVAGARLRVWTPQGAKIRYLKQVAPAISELTPMGTPVDARTNEYPIGAWGDETREYHLCVELPARAVGEEMLASRVSVVIGSRAVSTALVKASWTDDQQRSTHIHRRVAHFTGQAQLAQAIDDGLAARQRGDDRLATERFGRAVILATENGNEATLQLLRQVVEIDDAATGTVRLRPDIDAADEMALETRSVKTVPVRGMAAPLVG